MNNLLINAAGLEGNISNCEIQTVMIDSGKHSIFQLSVTETYQVFNKCDGSILSSYESVRGSDTLGLLLIIIILLLMFVLSVIPKIYSD